MIFHKIEKDYDINTKKLIDSFVKNHLEENVFHTFSLFDLFNKTPNYYPVIIYATDANNNVCGILLATTIKENKGVKGFFSSRTIIWDGPFIASGIQNSEFIIKQFLNELDKTINKKSIYTEFRNQFSNSTLNDIFIKSGFEHIDYLNVKINLRDSSLNDIISKMKYNRRREIKLSLQENANYTLAENLTEVKEVYSILKDLYKNKVKLPLPSFDFFENLFNSRIGKVFIVKHNNKIIGGNFCLCSSEAVYTWYYCGITDYHKKIYPTHLSILAAIEYAISNEIPKIDFMGAGKPNTKYGVRDYKLQFGGDLIETGRYVKINSRFLYFIGKTGLKIMSKIITR